MCAEQSALYRYNISTFQRLPMRGWHNGAIIGVLFLWAARARQRRALRNLDDRLLRDIGIGRVEAELEARKPFWRA